MWWRQYRRGWRFRSPFNSSPMDFGKLTKTLLTLRASRASLVVKEGASLQGRLGGFSASLQGRLDRFSAAGLQGWTALHVSPIPFRCRGHCYVKFGFWVGAWRVRSAAKLDCIQYLSRRSNMRAHVSVQYSPGAFSTRICSAMCRHVSPFS